MLWLASCSPAIVTHSTVHRKWRNHSEENDDCESILQNDREENRVDDITEFEAWVEWANFNEILERDVDLVMSHVVTNRAETNDDSAEGTGDVEEGREGNVARRADA